MPIYGLGNITPAFGNQHTAASVGGTTNETTLYSVTIPANTLGPNGVLSVLTLWTHTNSANNKQLKVKIGATLFASLATGAAAGTQNMVWVRNRNSVSSQIFWVATTATVFGTSSGAPATSTVDFSQDQTLSVTGTTTLETGFAATSCTRSSNVVTVNKASHGLNTGEYVQVAGATPSAFNADPVQITRVDANNFTYANTGADDVTTVQPTIKRYSVIQLDSVCVEVMK